MVSSFSATAGLLVHCSEKHECSKPPTMLMPRLSPGFLISSTMCGVSQDDAIRLSPDCCGDGLVPDTGIISGEMCSGVRDK